jgi:N-acetylglucosaminyldiphosphoundecaprenol N-acetyl-beta-D-mannosaminyltransferase
MDPQYPGEARYFPFSIFPFPLPPRVAILGVNIDAITMADALARLRALLQDGGHHHVMTPNSEMLVAAARDPSFREILHATSLNLPDGVGLLWMARWRGQRLPQRVAGVDVVTRLLADLDEHCGVFLLGAAPGIADRAAAEVRRRNPRLRIVGTHGGSPHDADAQDIIERIRAAAPALLLVAYGAPAQDRWIRKHLHQLPSVRVAMGVGGTFDFLAGVQRRAPALLRTMGLEWAWRLAREPQRWKRILTATVVFPWMVMTRGELREK